MSRTVERLIQRPYSHIFIVYKDLVYQAVPGGIETEPYADYLLGHDIIGSKEVELHCDEQTFLAHYQFYRGLPYTYSQALAFIPVFGKLFDNDRKRAWCSEYVCWVLNDLGHRWDLAEGDLTTPAVFERI
jgi:hypothetical protein